MWLDTDACPLQELRATVTWKFNRFLSSSSDRNFRRMFFSVCFFLRVSFLPKAIYKHGRQHIFLFSWLMYLVLFYNWEVQERHAFLHNPLSLKSAVYHLFCFVFFLFFWKAFVWYIKRREHQWMWKSAGFSYFGVFEKRWQTAFPDLSAFSSRKHFFSPPRLQNAQNLF